MLHGSNFRMSPHKRLNIAGKRPQRRFSSAAEAGGRGLFHILDVGRTEIDRKRA
ncbi:MAG: hypothetical protein WCY72_06700 [Lysobacteraceae bacterium]